MLNQVGKVKKASLTPLNQYKSNNNLFRFLKQKQNKIMNQKIMTTVKLIRI